MPYIRTDLREKLRPRCDPALTAGELNYQFTCLMLDYVSVRGGNYTTFNDVLGALEGAKLEFYRRVLAPYEDKKIGENGDVYNR